MARSYDVPRRAAVAVAIRCWAAVQLFIGAVALPRSNGRFRGVRQRRSVAAARAARGDFCLFAMPGGCRGVPSRIDGSNLLAPRLAAGPGDRWGQILMAAPKTSRNRAGALRPSRSRAKTPDLGPVSRPRPAPLATTRWCRRCSARRDRSIRSGGPRGGVDGALPAIAGDEPPINGTPSNSSGQLGARRFDQHCWLAISCRRLVSATPKFGHWRYVVSA